MKPTLLLALCLSACSPTGINSASAAHACHVATQAATAFEIIRADLAAAGFTSAKIEAVLPLIRAGKVVVTVGCEVVVAG